MEEIKSLIELVAKLPTMAIWVIALFWAYKVVVVGSVYGLIRFGIDKLHSWLTGPKYKHVEVRMLVDGQVISGSKDALMLQLERLKRTTGVYIHASDIDWLRAAIDDKFAKDAAEEREKTKGKISKFATPSQTMI